MIENNEIHAEYFKSTLIIAFDLNANVNKIDILMQKFDDWGLNHCNNCGNKISDKMQKICEYCG